ncbi:MAG: hypothetical protein JWL90_343 [Chthoniobacteraceae bacterium]|nr:hypothetical protein [Chthoniobacteraceae bacterium]
MFCRPFILLLFFGFLRLVSARGDEAPVQVVEWGENFNSVYPGFFPGHSPQEIAQIAAGRYFAVALKTGGRFVQWGRTMGFRDPTGYPVTTEFTPPPQQLSIVIAIAAGYQHVLALNYDGTVSAWGYLDPSQRPIAENLRGIKAIAAGYYSSMALENDGTVVAWGNNNEGQCSVPDALTDVKAIAMGADFAMALKTDGTIAAWGSGVSTQLPAGLSGVMAIAAGAHHALALQSDGHVVSWGENLLGATLVPPGLDGVTAIAAGINHSLALKNDGTVVAWGGNSTDLSAVTGQSVVPAGLRNVTLIAAGGYHSLALGSPVMAAPEFIGAVKASVISENFLNLDITIDPHFDNTSVLVEVGLDTNYGDTLSAYSGSVSGSYPARLNPRLSGLLSGRTYHFRVTASNQAGTIKSADVTFATSKKRPTAIDDSIVVTGKPFTFNPLENDLDADGFGLKIQSVTNGTDGTVTISENLLTYTPRPNSSGITSIDDRFTYTVAEGGTATVTVTGHSTAVVDMVATHGHALTFDPRENDIVTDGLTVAGVTQPFFGQVSVTGNLLTYRPAPNSPDVDRFTYTLSDGSSAFVLVHKTLPAQNATIIPWGAVFTVAPPPQLRNVAQIAVGNDFALALKKEGRVTGWGENFSAGLSIPNNLSGVRVIAAGNYHALALKEDGKVVAWGYNNEGQTKVPPQLIGVKAIAAGIGHSLALKNNGKVVAWGSNTNQQCNVPAGLAGVIAIAASTSYSLALQEGGTVVAWGSGFPVSSPPPAGRITAIAAGVSDALALKEDGTVESWGQNPNSAPPGLNGVTAIAAGYFHFLALKNDGTVVAWNSAPTDHSPAAIVQAGLENVLSIAAGGSYSVAIAIPTWPFAEPAFPSGITVTQGGPDSVLLRTEIDPHPEETVVRFEYGPDLNYGILLAPRPSIVRGNLPVVLEQTVTGLIPGKTYHFRATAISAFGTNNTEDVSFLIKTVPLAVADAIVISGLPQRLNPTANDLDPGGYGLGIESYTQGLHGKVERGADSELIYTPSVASSGASHENDHFTYTLQGGSKATVTVLNHSRAVIDTIFSHDAPVTFDPLQNDFLPASGKLTIQSVTQPLYGQISFSGRLITYTPAPAPDHSDYFTYTLTDQSTGLVNVTRLTEAYEFRLNNSQNVPGESPDTFYGKFGVPAIGAFSGTLKRGDGSLVKALFGADGAVRMKEGDRAPGIDDASIVKLNAPNGRAVLATVRSVSGALSTVLYTGIDSQNIKAAVRTGSPVPALEGVRFQSIGAFDGNGLTVFFLATLEGNHINRTNRVALCAAFEDGSSRVLARVGDSFGQSTITGLATLVGVQGSLAEGRWRLDDHTIGVLMTLSDKNQVICSIPDTAEAADQWVIWKSTGTIAFPDDGFDDVLISSFGLPAFGRDGVVCTAAIAVAPARISSASDTVVMRIEVPGRPQLVMQQGDFIPNLGSDHYGNLTVKTMSNPVQGRDGNLAFFGTLAGKGLNARNNTALFINLYGSQAYPIARIGKEAQGGGCWSRFISVVLPDLPSVKVVFTATLTSSPDQVVTKENNLGLWACIDKQGFVLLLRTGEKLLVDGVSKTIRNFVALAPAAGSIGAASGYDDDGHLAVQVTFDDRTESLLRIKLPIAQ